MNVEGKKNKFILIITQDAIPATKAKLLEKGYRDMEVNPSDINSTEIALITKTGVAESSPNLVSSVDAIPPKTDNADDKTKEKDAAINIKKSGKELPTVEQSKENVADATIVNPEKKESLSDVKQTIKESLNNKFDESDDDAEKRFAVMSKNKGFRF